MSGCGCKKKSTPQPVNPPATVKITESSNNGQLTQQEKDLLDQVKNKLN